MVQPWDGGGAPLRLGAILLLIDLAALAVARFVLHWRIWDPTPAYLGFHLLLATVCILAASPSAIGIRSDDTFERRRAFLRWLPILVGVFVAFCVGGILLAVILKKPEWIRSPNQIPNETEGWLWIAKFIVIHPLAEEVIYRGMAHGTLRPLLGRGVAILVGGAVFGFVHFLYGIPAEFAIFYGLGGVALTMTYERTGSLFYPWIVHVALNSLALLLGLHPEWFETAAGWAR